MYPEVKFNNIAHAIPHMLGNNSIFDRLECDSCNSFFAQNLDHHFGNWSLPWRTIGRIKKKRGFPSAATDDLTVQAKSAREIEISLKNSKPIFQGDYAIIDIKRSPFIPCAVLKSLVKMAISVCPEEYQFELELAKQWIMCKEHSLSGLPISYPEILLQKVPGPMPNNMIHYALFRRIIDSACSPYFIFFIQFANYSIQLSLPVLGPGDLVKKSIINNSIKYPNIFWELLLSKRGFGIPEYVYANLGGTEKVENDIERIVTYGKAL